MQRAGEYVHQDQVLELFDFMKRPSENISESDLAIHFRLDEKNLQLSFALRPIGITQLTNSALITKMAAWREQHQYAFPTRFDVTFEGTSNWLKNQVIENKKR